LNAQYIKTRLTTDKHADRINEVVEHIDGLRHQDSQEIGMAVAAGAIERWKWNLHLNLYAWILQKLDEDDKYLDKSIADIKTDMEAMAKVSRPIDEI